MTKNGISSKAGYVWPKDKNPPDVNVYEKKGDKDTYKEAIALVLN